MNDVVPLESGFLQRNPSTGIIRETIDVSQMPAATSMSGEDSDSETSIILRNIRRNLENHFCQQPPSSNASSSSTAHDVTMDSTLPRVRPHASPPNADRQVPSPRPSVSENNGDAVAANFPSLDDRPTKRRRKRVSYAKKYFFGTSAMYYKPQDSCPLPAALPELC